MDTVRLARDLGNVSGLLPTGIRRLRDIPYQLAQAIKAALTFVSWEENVPSGDMPPRWMWTDTERINEHFEAIRRRDDDRMHGRSNGGETVKNDAARTLIVG